MNILILILSVLGCCFVESFFTEKLWLLQLNNSTDSYLREVLIHEIEIRSVTDMSQNRLVRSFNPISSHPVYCTPISKDTVYIGCRMKLSADGKTVYIPGYAEANSTYMKRLAWVTGSGFSDSCDNGDSSPWLTTLETAERNLYIGTETGVRMFRNFDRSGCSETPDSFYVNPHPTGTIVSYFGTPMLLQITPAAGSLNMNDNPKLRGSIKVGNSSDYRKNPPSAFWSYELISLKPVGAMIVPEDNIVIDAISQGDSTFYMAVKDRGLIRSQAAEGKDGGNIYMDLNTLSPGITDVSAVATGLFVNEVYFATMNGGVYFHQTGTNFSNQIFQFSAPIVGISLPPSIN